MLETGESKLKMDNGALKHICLWIVLLFLFFLLLYGVHQFFFSRMESRATNKISLIEPAMKNRTVKKDNETAINKISHYAEKEYYKSAKKEKSTLNNKIKTQ